VRLKRGRYYFNGGEERRDMPLGDRLDMGEYARLMRECRGEAGSEPPMAIFRKLARAAKVRAAQRGLVFDLTADYLLQLYRTNGGRCAVTGIPFDMRVERTTRVRPYGVSVDRIECRGPYTRENVRLILTALNIAINEFGWGTYLTVARAAIAGQLRKEPRIADMTVTPKAAVTA
jgi:hypothetical protein